MNAKFQKSIRAMERALTQKEITNVPVLLGLKAEIQKKKPAVQMELQTGLD